MWVSPGAWTRRGQRGNSTGVGQRPRALRPTIRLIISNRRFLGRAGILSPPVRQSAHTARKRGKAVWPQRRLDDVPRCRLPARKRALAGTFRGGLQGGGARQPERPLKAVDGVSVGSWLNEFNAFFHEREVVGFRRSRWR